MGLFSNFFGGAKTRQAPSSVWEGQVPFLTGLYGQAQNLAGSQAGIGQFASDLSQRLMGGLGDFGSPRSNPAFQNLLARSQGSNPYLDQQIEGLGRDAGRFLTQVGMPGIRNQYGDIGGNSRLQLQTGQLRGDVFRDYLSAATNLRSNAYQQGGQAAAMLGGLSNDYLGNLSGLFNLGMSPWQAQWMPLQQFGNLVGSPTVLGGGATGQGPGLGYSLLNSFLSG